MNLRNPWIELDIIDPNYVHYNQSWEKYKMLIRHIKCKLDQLNKSLEMIIDYNYLTESVRHFILCSSEIRVCPYCNRQYITAYNKDGNLRSTSDLDHFYPKAAFQLYSLILSQLAPYVIVDLRSLENLKFYTYMKKLLKIQLLLKLNQLLHIILIR